MAAAKPALPAISRSKTAASSAFAGISAAKPRKPSTPQTSPSRPASSTSKPTPTSRYRSIQRRKQDEPGRHHRVIGHCGFSVAPALPGKFALLKNYLSPSAPWLPFKEMSFPQYLDTFPATSVNAGVLVGHNTLRLMVTGIENERGRSASAGRIRFGWLEPATTRRIEALVLHDICASQHEFERNFSPS